jgi:hypothetical protein
MERSNLYVNNQKITTATLLTNIWQESRNSEWMQQSNNCTAAAQPYTTKHDQSQHFHDEVLRKQVTTTSATRL